MVNAPNDVKVRLFLNSTWVDVSTDVRDESGVVITTGRQDESSEVNPGSCRFSLDNRDGAYTPRNPTSPYYGSLNRNTPVCVLLDEVVDTFSRTVASGWGTADTADVWNAFGAGGTVSGTDTHVALGVGTHSVPVTGAYRMNYFNAASGGYLQTSYNGEVVVSVSTSVAAVSGSAIEPANALIRFQDTTNYYMARATVEPGGAVKIGIYRGNNTSIAAAVATGYTYSGTSTKLWVRAGAFDSVIYAKAWVGTLADEPAAWQVSATDATYGYGYFGVRSGVSGGNTNSKPITFDYDDLKIYTSQFNGEIPSWPQKFDDSGEDAVVNVQGAGILRRLKQGKIPLQSSLRRYYEHDAVPAPAYYAPLDEGDLSTQAAATLPATGGRPFTVVSTGIGTFLGIDSSNEKHFGQGKIGSWLDPTLVVYGVSEEAVNNQDQGVTVAVVGTTWTVDVVRAGGAGTNGVFGVVEFEGFGPTDGGIWNLNFDVDDDLLIVSPPSGTIVSLTASSLTHKPYDGAGHHHRIYVVNNGSNLDWKYYLDGVQEASGTETGRHALDIGSIYYQGQATLKPQPVTALGHVAVFTADATGNLATVNARFKGTTQEAADVRFKRLLDEQGITNFVSTSNGALMGPQFRLTLVDQFKEVAVTDGGSYRELVSARGLHYDTLSSIYDLGVDVTLDVGAGHLMPPFAPVDDDLNVRNDVTAAKRNGGNFRYEQSSGRLGTADPASGGAGRYDEHVEANPYSESQLPGIAQRLVAVGTVDESRFPTASVNLMSDVMRGDQALRRQVMNVFPNRRIRLTGMDRWSIYDDADLMVVGYTRVLASYVHQLTFNCVPYSPYRALVLDTDRIDTDTSTTHAGFAATGVSSFQVDESSGSLWTTDAGDFPLDVVIGGERITISAVSGASSPQTFTVSARSVNGVVKAHSAGEAVSLADPVRLG